MCNFEEKCNAFYQSFGAHKAMVLSTSFGDKVTSRMMSVILLEDAFYFQTDKNFRKYEQIKQNPHVAFCVDNIQIEGICTEVGTPADNSEFCSLYKKYFPNSFTMYSLLDSEVLFEVKPTFIQKWIYEENKPFVETWDFALQEYKKSEYKLIGETNDN